MVNDGRCVRLANEARANDILAGFTERSREIQQEGFVEESWQRFCETLASDYALHLVSAVGPKWLHFLMRVQRKLNPRWRGFRKGADVAPLLNLLQCEAHNEALRTVLKNRLEL